MSWKKILILLAVIAVIHLIVIAAIANSGNKSVPDEETSGSVETSGSADPSQQIGTDQAEKKTHRSVKLRPWDYRRKLSLPQALSKQAEKASAVIIVDLAERRVLWEKNAEKSVPVASLTKLMTALLLAEEMEKNSSLQPGTVVEMSRTAVAVEGRRFNAGDKLTVKDLFFAMMISSANDAAAQAAISLSGDTESFVKKMNDRAAEMGLSGVKFNSPSGLPQGREKINSMASCDAVSR